MSKIKVYVQENFLETLKNEVGSNHQVVWQSDNYCIKSLTASNGVLTMQVSFKNYANNNYMHFNSITWSDDLGVWLIGSSTSNSTKPTKCINGDVASPVFGSVSTIYDELQLTSDFYYHPNFDSILVIFFIITIVCIYFPYKIFSRAFGRWFKV